MEVLASLLQHEVRPRYIWVPQNPLKGYVRNAFINSAVDEILARSNFRTTSSGKPNGSVMLEGLKVRVSGGGSSPIVS